MNDWIPLREVPMGPFETPPEVLERARRAAQQVAIEMEAAIVAVMTATYRDGWADGYLARQREIDAESPPAER